MYNGPVRSEQEIFDDLATLCSSKGYIHAVAIICFRDNVAGFSDELKAEDMARLYSKAHLIRTEVTTLIGLMLRAPVILSLPTPEVLSGYIERSEALLEELHHTMTSVLMKNMPQGAVAESGFNPFTRGDVLRESIFYSAESAYAFQYRDLAPRKYSADADWLLHNRGIDLRVGREVCRSIAELLSERLLETLQGPQRQADGRMDHAARLHLCM